MIWLAIFAVQGVQLTRCLIEVGPTQTVWLAMESSVGWSMGASAVVGVLAVIWYVVSRELGLPLARRRWRLW